MQANPLRVALVGTAPAGVPGSMRAYADLLLQAFAAHAPGVDAQLVELDPEPARGGLSQRLNTLALPLRARRRRGASPDVWHVLDGSRAYVAGGLRGAPTVITAHDIIPRLQQRGCFPGAPAVGIAAGWLWRRNGVAMRAAQVLVCDSECTRRDVEREYAAAGSARVVALPVRPSLAALAMREAPQREQGVVLHIGNNGFYKRREQVVRIFARMQRGLARKLVMIGPPPTQALRALVDALQLDTAVDWIEDAGDAIVADCYQRASVMVFPSLYEGYGWPVLEAMVFGLPVVASDGGSLPEVAGTAAPCLPPDDIEGFVRETEALLRDPELAARRAQVGRDHVVQFGIERFAREMVQVYRSACEARGASGR